MQAAEAEDQDADEGGEGCGLGPGTHESGNRRRSALVDVGGPHVERGRGDLEQEAGREQQHSGHGHRVAQYRRVGGEIKTDVGDVGGPGDTVDQGDAVEQEAGGEGAEQEILEASLVGAQLPTEQAGQDVKGDGEDLETEEDGHQVGPRGHPHRPGGGEEDQRIVLADRVPFPFQVVVGHQDRQTSRKQEGEVEEGREIVERHVPGETELGIVPAEVGKVAGHHQRDDAQPGHMPGMATLGEDAHQQQDHTETGQHQRGHYGPEVHVLHGDLHQIFHGNAPSEAVL